MGFWVHTPLMKPPLMLGVCFVALLLALSGCETRSISNAGYDRYGRNSYAGELTEFEVLGVDTAKNVTDADIAEALKTAGGARLQRTSKILLIQSGADFPDAAMQAGLSARFQVTPFSGKPEVHNRWDERKTPPTESYAKSLRLAAARGGYDKIVCYWGVLESEQVNQATKFVSWVPLVGYAVPDKRENMRIRLKAVIVDVASGRWTMVTPKPFESTALSSIYSRRDKDQTLVAQLKEQGYAELSNTLATAYTD